MVWSITGDFRQRTVDSGRACSAVVVVSAVLVSEAFFASPCRSSALASPLISWRISPRLKFAFAAPMSPRVRSSKPPDGRPCTPRAMLLLLGAAATCGKLEMYSWAMGYYALLRLVGAQGQVPMKFSSASFCMIVIVYRNTIAESARRRWLEWNKQILVRRTVQLS